MQNPRFNRNPLAAGVALALGASAMAPALAQDANDEVIEEIITTGLRGSLMQSMDRKGCRRRDYGRGYWQVSGPEPRRVAVPHHGRVDRA